MYYAFGPAGTHPSIIPQPPHVGLPACWHASLNRRPLHALRGAETATAATHSACPTATTATHRLLSHRLPSACRPALQPLQPRTGCSPRLSSIVGCLGASLTAALPLPLQEEETWHGVHIYMDAWRPPERAAHHQHESPAYLAPPNSVPKKPPRQDTRREWRRRCGPLAWMTFAWRIEVGCGARSAALRRVEGLGLLETLRPIVFFIVDALRPDTRSGGCTAQF